MSQVLLYKRHGCGWWCYQDSLQLQISGYPILGYGWRRHAPCHVLQWLPCSIQEEFLLWTWEDDLVQEKIITQGSSTFLTWVNKVWNANDKLKITKSPYHIPNDCLHLHLIPQLSKGLKCLCPLPHASTAIQVSFCFQHLYQRKEELRPFPCFDTLL